MIVTKDYNEGVEKIVASLKIPKRPVVFKLVNIPERRGKLRIPNAKWVPPSDRILLDEGEVQIGYVIGKNTDGSARLGDIWFNRSSMGRIVLRPAESLQHRRLYEYLYLSNYNASNPHRDHSVAPIYEVENNSREAKEKLSVIEHNTTAVDTAIKLSKKDIRLLAEYYGMDARDTPDVLQLKLVKEAQKDPRVFMEANAYIAKDGHHLSLVRKGMRHDLIQLDKRGFKWKWKDTGEVFRQGNSDISEDKNSFALAEWLRNSEDGQKVAKILEKKIKPFEEDYALD